jgi:hypothetical protein
VKNNAVTKQKKHTENIYTVCVEEEEESLIVLGLFN